MYELAQRLINIAYNSSIAILLPDSTWLNRPSGFYWLCTQNPLESLMITAFPNELLYHFSTFIRLWNHSRASQSIFIYAYLVGILKYKFWIKCQKRRNYHLIDICVSLRCWVASATVSLQLKYFKWLYSFASFNRQAMSLISYRQCKLTTYGIHVVVNNFHVTFSFPLAFSLQRNQCSVVQTRRTRNWLHKKWLLLLRA